MKNYYYTFKKNQLIFLLIFSHFFASNILAQDTYKDIVVRFNYKYLDLDLVDNSSINTFKFKEVLNEEGKEQLKLLETQYANLGNYRLSKIFGFMSWKDSISTSRLGNQVTIPPFWATFTLYLPPNEDYRKLMYFLDQAAPLIDYAEPSFPVELQSPPNDTLYARQKSLNGTPSLPFAGINIDEAWEMETGEPFIKVGVLDSGIDSANPDIKVLYGAAYFTTDSTYFYGLGVDTDIHGTAVAGIIGAKRNNETGIAGIAGGNNDTEKGVSLIDFKFNFGSYPGNQYICAAVVDGARSVGTYWNYVDSSSYYQATGNQTNNTDYFRKTPGFGIHIDNHSYVIRTTVPIPTIQNKDLPVGNYLETNCNLCREAFLFSLKNGVINVAARGNNGHQPAGNAGSYVNTFYPQSFPDNWIVSVGASGYDGTTVRQGVNQSAFEAQNNYYSLYGGNMDLIAPGSDSIVFSTTSSFYPGPIYAGFNGTSAAAPHVSGVIGLLLSYYNRACYSNRNLSIEDVEYVLQKSATDVLTPNFDLMSGAGRLDAGKAMKMIEFPKKQIVHPDSLVSSVEIERDTIALRYNKAFVAEGWGPISRNFQLNRDKNYKVVRVAYENTYSFAAYILPTTEILDYWVRQSVSNSTELYNDTTSSMAQPGIWHFDNFEMNPYVTITDFNTTTKQIKLKGYYYHFIEQYANNSFIPEFYINKWHPANPEIDSAKMGFSIYLKDSTLTSLYDFPCDSDNILYDSTYVPYENTAGIEEVVTNEMEVYPNPTNETLNIRFTNSAIDEKKMTLIDLQGKEVGSWTTTESKFIIPMNNLTQGIYILNCSINDKNQTFKIIKL